jgi:probable F420-dependent oxidoreductase
MHFDAILPMTGLTGVAGIAEAAEQMGFNALWTSETQHDPFLPCTLIAEHTKKLQFGTAIAVSFARTPASLAYLAWDLAAQSEGRFILGLGTQVKAHIERRFGMPWPDSVVGKLREQIQAIRAFWNSWQNNEKLDFRGEYYKLTLMSPFFNPGPSDHPDIPIYIAGVNRGLARLAGETCQGFHAHPFSSPRYLDEVILPAIAAGAAKAGRSRTEILNTVTAFVATTPEEETFARAQISFYASTPSYRSVMELHGWADVAEQLSRLAPKGQWGEMFGLITDEMLHTFCLVTDQASLPSELKKRFDGLADRLCLYIPFVPGERDEFWQQMTGEFYTTK